MNNRRRLFASFSSDELLRESGRLPFTVLTPFVRSGYEVHVHAGLRDRLVQFYGKPEAELPETARMSLSVPGVEYDRTLPDDPQSWDYLYDRPGVAAHRLAWRRRLQLRSDLFSPYWLRAPVIAPYAMHPAQSLRVTPTLLRELRSAPRTLRVMFAGDSKGYARNRVRYPAPKLPRLEVLKMLRERTADALIEVDGVEEILRLSSAGFVERFVLSDSGSGIPPQNWLPTLAKADFFLCPPGIVMPMCHNVIEAMAVGTIPLIGYPEWFHPKLRHGENCIAFEGEDDLVAKMRMVLSMPRPEVERMRAEVVTYYDQHLRPETLVRAVEARPERDLNILVYTERNMAQHADDLGPSSVLMRGPEAGGPLRWLGQWLDGRTDRDSDSPEDRV